MKKDYNDYIKSLKLQEELYLMGDQVKQIDIKNMPFTSDKTIVFGKNNIITSENEWRKTFLIKLIYDAYLSGRNAYQFFTEIDQCKKINAEIKFHSALPSMYRAFKKNISKVQDDSDNDKKEDVICFLFNKPSMLTNQEGGFDFLTYLKQVNAQMILTSDQNEHYNYPKEYTIIDL